jgi:hypothetical protein
MDEFYSPFIHQNALLAYCHAKLSYIVWQILENKLDWFSLQNGEYVPLEADVDGTIKSRIFPGLWLAMLALLAGEMTKVLAVLQQGLKSQEHSEFVQHLSGQSQY